MPPSKALLHFLVRHSHGGGIRSASVAISHAQRLLQLCSGQEAFRNPTSSLVRRVSGGRPIVAGTRRTGRGHRRRSAWRGAGSNVPRSASGSGEVPRHRELKTNLETYVD